MRSILLLLVTYTALSSAFVPQQLVVYRATTLRASNTHHKPDMTGDIDIGHAKYCADHFGECSLEEMEKIRNALHEERIAQLFSNTGGFNNPHGLEEDIEHKLLESDLTLQMGLLQDKLATEHMKEDTMAAYGMNPKSATMTLPVMNEMLDEESSEALMICMAIAGLALLPQFF